MLHSFSTAHIHLHHIVVDFIDLQDAMLDHHFHFFLVGGVHVCCAEIEFMHKFAFVDDFEADGFTGFDVDFLRRVVIFLHDHFDRATDVCGLRRLPLESGYFEAYNRPNVRLVDLNEAPIERITHKGVRTTAEDHELDILIYATGFDGVTGGYDSIDILGPGGRRLRDDWKDDLPKTFLGVLNDGFPNLLMVLRPHTSRGNIPRHIEKVVDFNVGIVRYMRENGYHRVEARTEEAEKWLAEVIEVNRGRLAGNIPSWQTGVNANVPGRQTIRVLGYYGGAMRYRELTEKIAAGGYKELAFR
jgi:hypothetical protein